MSESAKPRFAVDLNEIERQLAQPQAAPSNQAVRNDQLAELARIVGQADPFQSLLSQEQAPARPSEPDFDAMFQVPPQTARQQAPGQDFASGLEHQAYDLDEYRHPAPAQAYRSPMPAQGQDSYPDPVYDQAYEQAAYADPSVGSEAYDGSDMRSLQPRRPRKRLMVAGAIIAAIVIGGGGAWLMSGRSSLISSGPPPVIKASADPIKVQPENPGGVEIPNQNKQIYERANQTTDTKVVNHEEQPVDVKEATRMAAVGAGDASGAAQAPASAPLPASPAPAVAPAPQPAQANTGTALNLGEPRKVRSVAIRPDGAMTATDGGNANQGAAARPAPVPPPPAMTLPAAARGTLPPSQAASPSAQTASAKAVQAAATPVTPSASTPKAVAASNPAPAGGAPPQKVASAQPMAPAAAASPSAEASGGFTVQLGVRPSEAEAQTAFRQFQQKFADLEGQPALIRKAEVNGATVYRVRVGPMSHDDASSLCSKLQGEGGQCFVAKN